MNKLKKPTISINAIKASPNKNITNATNLTFSYDKREDRMFFIVNHSDINNRIDFFVTRRMIIKILDAFDLILINDCDNGKVFKDLYKNQEVLKTEAIIKKEIKKPEKQLLKKEEVKWEKSINTNDLNFTKTKESLILDSLSYTISGDNIIFKFITKNKTLAISNMNKVTFQRTVSSIMRVVPFLEWGISPHILD